MNCASYSELVFKHLEQIFFLIGMNAEIEAMMAANKAAMEESKEEADISQEEMASRFG